MIDLTRVDELRPLGRVLRVFNAAAGDLVDRPVIVGATARDLILHHVHGLRVPRATDDLDIAVATGSWAAYERLAERLIVAGARRDDRIIHRFFIEAWRVDAVPFGALERNGKIVWPQTGMTMSVEGFEEASENADEVTLPGNVRARVITPPGLAILKLVSWEDRHLTEPHHDAVDLRTLLAGSESWNQDRLYDEAVDLLEAFGFDNALAGAALLGRDIVRIARPRTLRRIRALVEHEVSNDRLALAADMGPRVEDNLALLKALRDGLASPITPTR